MLCGLIARFVMTILGNAALFVFGQWLLGLSVAALCVVTLFKRMPWSVLLNADDSTDENPPLNVPSAEQELKRKDRGTVPDDR